MRRRVLSALFVTAGVTAGLAMTVTAGAAGAEKTTYWAAECYGPQTGGTFTFSGKNGKIAHRRDATSTNDLYVWGNNGWELAGTDEVVINFDGEILSGVSAWGDFILSLEGIGDFDGKWAWGKGAVYGHGSGKGIGGSATEGKHVAVTWVRVQPEDWGADPFPGCSFDQPYIFLEVEIIDPHP